MTDDVLLKYTAVFLRDTLTTDYLRRRNFDKFSINRLLPNDLFLSVFMLIVSERNLPFLLQQTTAEGQPNV